ncbi:MAG: hypothetical protein U0838_17030 [Chloroflexota bacterium]
MRMMAGTEQRRQFVGLTLEQIELRAAREVGDRRAPAAQPARGALLAAMAAGGVPTDGQRGYHILWYLAQTGDTWSSGRRAGASRPRASTPGCRTPAGSSATRRSASWRRGTSQATGLRAWTTSCADGLTAKDVRRGIEVAGRALATRQFGGKTLLFGADTADALEAVAGDDAGVLLLPGFDEYILGYKDVGDARPRSASTRSSRAATACSRQPSSWTARSWAPGRRRRARRASLVTPRPCSRACCPPKPSPGFGRAWRRCRSLRHARALGLTRGAARPRARARRALGG